MYPLLTALECNTVVTSLALGGNQLADGSANALAGVLARNSTLTSIGLAQNYITDRGAVALYRALKKNHTVKVCGRGTGGRVYVVELLGALKRCG